MFSDLAQRHRFCLFGQLFCVEDTPIVIQISSAVVIA